MHTHAEHWWADTSGEMLLAEATVGQSATSLIPPAYGAEFHLWPDAAAGAWPLLAVHKPTPALFPSFS